MMVCIHSKFQCIHLNKNDNELLNQSQYINEMFKIHEKYGISFSMEMKMEHFQFLRIDRNEFDADAVCQCACVHLN